MMDINWGKIFEALGSIGSETTTASLALLLLFYLRRQEKELREEHAGTIRTLQRERRTLKREITELHKEIERLEDELDLERAARRAAEDEAHSARHGLKVLDGGLNA